MQRLLLIPLAMLILLAGALIWSGGGALRPADFTFINRGDVGTLDPNRMSWLQDIRIGYALWEGLYTLDSQTLEAVPGCADRIDVNPDKTAYTFHIRPAARWSNGDDLLAEDFVFAWRRMLQEPGDYTYLFHCIKGAGQYQEHFAARKTNPSEPCDFSSVGIRALDAKTLQVTLTHPVAYFPDLCAFPPFFPLHAESMRPFFIPEANTYRKEFTRPPNLVTNGPYRLASWEFKRRLRLQASSFYWDRANVRSQTLEMVTADDPLWAFLKYDSQTVDWMADASGPIGAELHKTSRKDLHVFPAFGTYFYSINCRPRLPDGRVNPFADVRVRRAFALAIDKRPIVQTVTRLGEATASTYIPPGVFPTYPSPPGLGFDVAEARRLLAEAGYPEGKNFPAVSILFNGEFQHAEIAQVIRRQWLSNLGVDVQLEGVEVKIFRQRLHGKDYVLARASWYGDYNDPSTFTDKYLSDSENNDSAWKNADYDRLCQSAATESDTLKRMNLLAKAEGILLESQPIIPLYHYVNASLFRENVTGIPLNPRGMVMFKSIKVNR